MLNESNNHMYDRHILISELVESSVDGNLENVKSLIEKGVNVNTIDEF